MPLPEDEHSLAELIQDRGFDYFDKAIISKSGLYSVGRWLGREVEAKFDLTKESDLLKAKKDAALNLALKAILYGGVGKEPEILHAVSEALKLRAEYLEEKKALHDSIQVTKFQEMVEGIATTAEEIIGIDEEADSLRGEEICDMDVAFSAYYPLHFCEKKSKKVPPAKI